MLRKVTCDGIGYSVVGLNDVRHVFAVAVPRAGTTLEAQARDALGTIEAVIREEGTHGSIVHQAVFMADECQIPECRRIMRAFYGDQLPATSYIPQHPCNGKLLAIEALGVGQGRGECTIDRVSEQVVTVTHNGMSWVHCSNVRPRKGIAGVYNQTISTLSGLRGMLAGEGVGFERIIRTWFYLGDIVGPEGDTQRYKELNRARAAFFEGVSFLTDCLPPSLRNVPAFPASTGIGADDRSVMLSCIALVTDRPDIVAVPLENPRQVPAFDYGAVYSPQSPKFARAMALSCGDFATIFISGTASITNSESRHIGDAAAQAGETLDNIEALISESNLARHGLPGLGTTLDNLGLVRVYIKRQEDYEATRAVCRARIGDLPTVYVIADVCRPELLVEIEGIAFSRRRA
jgi:enamine deaminase RidA (YjgF/YER057c/UK114 family)